MSTWDAFLGAGPAASGDQVMPLLLFVFPLLRCHSFREERRQHPTPGFGPTPVHPPTVSVRCLRQRTIHILSRHTSPFDHPLSPERFIPTVLYIIGHVETFLASNQSASLAKGLQLHMHPVPPSWLAPQLVPTKRTLPWSLNKTLRIPPFPLYRVYRISQPESRWIFPAELQRPSSLRTPRTETISDSLPGTPRNRCSMGQPSTQASNAIIYLSYGAFLCVPIHSRQRRA
jgi:hypothetical protein